MRKIKKFLWKTFLWFNIISIGLVVVFKFIPVYFTPLMAIRAVQNWQNDQEIIFSHTWVSLDEISSNLPKAVIASEDSKFLNHFGFDFDAMKMAYDGNKKGKKIKGGSTISQQTAKNVFLWQGRSYIRKGLEAYYTVLIELIWSKKRIMEVYLNSIEMGKGVYGAQAAAKHWYSKDAINLSREQAAGIAAILPAPLRFKASNSSGYITRRKTKIARYLQDVKWEE